MKTRYKIIFSLIIITALIFTASAYSDNAKLKPEAKGRLCLKCHETFSEKLKSAYVHTPVKNGECTGCHDPHTSSYGKLLSADSSNICISCHKEILPDKAQSSHKIVVDGNCMKCHDSHSSNNRFILLKAGNELCLDCHKDIGESLKTVRFKHKPAEDNRGCINCHNPHASAKYGSLLKKDIPALCIECHRTDNASFQARHSGYPVAGSQCTSCHNSHGSNKAAIVFENVHAPVAEKKCNKCHNEPSSKSPFATSKAGIELCRDCHKDKIAELLDKNNVHWPMLDKAACLNCHNPHASKGKNLVAAATSNVCGKCHSDTVELQERSKNNPKNTSLCKPVREGSCTACHDPHASDYSLLAPLPSMSFNVCDKCHEWRAHSSSHPIGEKTKDPRNKNLIVDCLSCHKACGTANMPRMTHFKNISEGCTQCHKELEGR
ncbi:MAG: cytochrome c3 family protein [Nitrospirae bacterium]|nr:cytochrome c3 family protein [Nitrospirota bacterium]